MYAQRTTAATITATTPAAAATPALLGHLAVHLLGLSVLIPWTHLRGHGVWPLLAASWDSEWYADIAERGYASLRSLAFFPLQPLLVRGADQALPGPFPGPAALGLLLAVAASFVAAWGIFAVGNHLHGRRTGTLLAVLWSAHPVALVQWMGYTESLFTALAAWTLYAVLTGRWLTAATLACLAGLTRPTGIAVAAAVMAAACFGSGGSGSSGSGGGSGGSGGNASSGTARPHSALLAGLIAPLGWLSYVGWVGLRLGRWDGYLSVQRHWNNAWDGGASTLREMRGLLVYSAAPPLFPVLVTGVLAASAVLFALCVAGRQPLPLLVFSAVMLLIVLGTDGVYFPRARFLLPAFPLLLPVAVALARARVTTAVLVVGGAALFSAYLGGYMTLVWPGAP
ncbi:mannosyltransferase family protein [Streptomyces sp. NPDC021093]|uniref:mannosyltransferase family protein n=1 Tax=Streptomyces sp. NPDC021093 TaxID=3365112 RepID=UPI0037949619